MAKRYNTAHHAAYRAFWSANPDSTHGDRTMFADSECRRQGISRHAAVVELPAVDPTDLPNRLRDIAQQIEDGDYGDAHNLAWVIDCGDGRIEIGLLGRAATIGAELHLLLTTGALKIAHGCVRWE